MNVLYYSDHFYAIGLVLSSSLRVHNVRASYSALRCLHLSPTNRRLASLPSRQVAAAAKSEPNPGPVRAAAGAEVSPSAAAAVSQPVVTQPVSDRERPAESGAK